MTGTRLIRINKASATLTPDRQIFVRLTDGLKVYEAEFDIMAADDLSRALFTCVQTQRGIDKPLPVRNRFGKIWLAITGH